MFVSVCQAPSVIALWLLVNKFLSDYNPLVQLYNETQWATSSMQL